MINTNKLRGLIVEHGYSQKDVAQYIGVTAKTFYDKMKTGKFNLNELDKMVEMLDIDDPTPVFFTQVEGDE